MNGGVRCFELENLRDEKRGTETKFFPVNCSPCIAHLLGGDVDGSVLFAVASNQLSGYGTEGATKTCNVVQSAVKGDQELVDAARFKLLHADKRCKLKLFYEFALVYFSCSVLFSISHVVNL